VPGERARQRGAASAIMGRKSRRQRRQVIICSNINVCAWQGSAALRGPRPFSALKWRKNVQIRFWVDTTKRMRGKGPHRPGRTRPLRFHLERGRSFDDLMEYRIDHALLASALWHRLCRGRDAAFGDATPVRFLAGGILSAEEERGPRRAAETCAVADDKAAWTAFRRWAKASAVDSRSAFAGHQNARCFSEHLHPFRSAT
jgi:hypothetical protein